MAREDLEALHGSLTEALRQARSSLTGETAQYIPELARAEPDRFAIALVTVDGDVLVVGDKEATFSLQSTCKPFLYASALAAFGRRTVRERVGVEPTGEAFNSFIRLEASQRRAGRARPHNPMVNAGAIAVAGLLARDVLEGPDEVVRRFQHLAGDATIGFDGAVFESERSTGHRNHAIAHLLKQFGVIDVAPDVALDAYLQSCSLNVTVESLARLGATLATGGRRAGDGIRVLPRWAVGDTLAVMSTCGMYDAAGHFAFEVGLPAKSGVSGALLAVVPGRFALALFSPRLDPHGTSVRGMAALRVLGDRLGLHAFHGQAAAARIRTPADIPGVAAATTPTPEEHTLATIVRRRRPFGRQTASSYAPRLASADPGNTALAICTVDGQPAAAGDHRRMFPIQAAANPFAFAEALEQLGEAATLAHTGVEPSGNRSDAIQMESDPVRPFNPMENTGAIALAGLLSGAGSTPERLLARFAGRPLTVDDEMRQQEEHAGDRNRAIASLLRAAGLLQEEASALRWYFAQCSIMVDVAALARMAGVLAAHGVDPVSGERVISARTAGQVMSVMYATGMHDASGEFAVSVGMPAKSGISGCIIAVAPGRLGAAAYAPGVDVCGFSVRGAAMLRDLSRSLDLRTFTPRRP